MSVEQAVIAILGEQLARSIIADMGIHWAIVAAVADARTNDDPHALQTLRAHLSDLKAKRQPS